MNKPKTSRLIALCGRAAFVIEDHEIDEDDFIAELRKASE